MFNIGPPEILLILLIALVVVGPAKLPELGRSIGRGLREFRKVQDEVRDSINFSLDVEPDRPAPKSRTPRTADPDHAASAEADTAPSAHPAIAPVREAMGDPPPPDVDPRDPGPAPDPPRTADTGTRASPPADTGAPSTNGSTPPPAEE
jgi:TatA/E family protein of Tat protein translocase